MTKLQKKLFSNIFLLVLINFLIKPFWTFGIDIKIIDIVNSDSYGFYYSVFNFTFLFHILIDVGINQYNNRDIARNSENFSNQFLQLFSLKLFFSFVYIIVTFSAAFFWFGYESERFYFLLILGINQIIHSLILYNRSNFTALFKFKLDSFFSVFDKIISILIFVYIFNFSTISNSLELNFKIEYLVFVQMFSLSISFILSFAILLFLEKVYWTKFNLKNFISYLKKTWPFATAVLIMTLYTRIDAVMIENLLPSTGKYETTLYAAGYKLLDALNQIPFLFASFLIPVFANLLKNKKDIKPIFNAALKMLLSISIGATIVVFFWKGDILELLYSNKYQADWNDSFMFLIISFNTAVIIYVTGSLLTAHNKMIAISKMSLIALLINIVLNYFLIKQKGAAGASLATLITQTSMAIMQIALVLKLWRFNFSIQYLLKFVVYTLTLGLASYFLRDSIYNIGIIVFLALGMALSLNLIEWRLFFKIK